VHLGQLVFRDKDKDDRADIMELLRIVLKLAGSPLIEVHE
jgi:hypothetical protein